MNSSVLSLLVAAPASGESPAWWVNVVPILGMVMIFWFLILRPQMKQQKEHRAKLSGLKKGDEVLTGGGFVGKIVKVDETYAEVELAQGLKVKALKSTITDVIPPAGARPAND